MITKVNASAQSPAAAALQRQAHGGAYAVWLQITVPVRPGSMNVRTLGPSRLAKLFTRSALDTAVEAVNGPCYAVVSSKGSRPCLYLRAKTRSDFKALAQLLNALVKGEGGHASVLDATIPAYDVIWKGIDA